MITWWRFGDYVIFQVDTEEYKQFIESELNSI